MSDSETPLPVGEMPPVGTIEDVGFITPQPTPVANKHKSNRKIIYACTKCGRLVGRSNLKVKRVVFREMGVHGVVVHSRVTDWLCVTPQEDGGPSCLEADPAWQQPKLKASPGMADTSMAKDTGPVDYESPDPVPLEA